MHKIIQHLQTDHQNMKKVLSLLEQQLQLFAVGDTPNFDVMQDSLDYLTNVAEKLHHPIEDFICKRIKNISQEADNEIKSILIEHEEISRQTLAFINTLNEIILDAMIPREDVLKEGQAFIATNLQHIEHESDLLFPIFNQFLNESEWIEIEHKIYDGDNPLYDPTLEKQYQDLFNSILESVAR